MIPIATPTPRNQRYEASENPPLLTSIGYGLQFSLIASATLLVTRVVVADASGKGESYLLWMVFASLVVCGVSTLIQVRWLGPVGAGAVLPMFTAAFSIPFCITAVVDGGPATLTTLVLVTAVTQIAISKWLFSLRWIVTLTVDGRESGYSTAITNDASHRSQPPRSFDDENELLKIAVAV